MRLQEYMKKVRKSLGLAKPGEFKESGRFNLALCVLNDAAAIELESRSMIDKLKSHDVSTSLT